MTKNWKAVEKRICEWLDGVIPATRNSKIFMGDAVEDIAWDGFSIEVKSRNIFPKYLYAWFEQATTNANGKVPIIIWHHDGMRIGKQLVVIKAEDFKNLVERWEGNAGSK